MPTKRIPWFKVWVGATRHEKVATLDDRAFRTWVELLDAASQQTVRGKFASPAAAAAVVRRPVAAVKCLVAVGLIDERDDGVWMHDWQDWQRWRPEDDTNSDPSPPEPPPINGRSTHDQHTNGTIEKGEERREKKDVVPSEPYPGEMSPGDDRVDAVYGHFKERIQTRSRLCPRKKIAARLRHFSADELCEGIDHFADDPWWMANNASRGAEWFFESDSRSEQFLLMTPRPAPVPINGRAATMQAEHDRMEAEFGYLDGRGTA